MKLRIRKNIFLFLFYSILVLFVGYYTYFRDYANPPALFWDENYHIAAAYKYLNTVMFMESHPPLGKLLIALGEFLFHPNNNLNMTSALTADYIKNIPQGFSFVGVRFFPVLLGTLSSLLLFFIFIRISGHYYLSFLFSSLYLFDNALILQSRGAMLESPLIFFSLAAILYFIIVFDKKVPKHLHYLCLGILVGLAVSVKPEGALLVLLLPLLAYYDFQRTRHIGLVLLKGIVFLIGSSFIICLLYYFHIFLGQRIMQNRYYGADPVYKDAIINKKEHYLQTFPSAFVDNLRYIQTYNTGIPKYNAKSTSENGSLPYGWPFGDKAINYRWEKAYPATKYLYLQGNPVIWLASLFGLICSLILISLTILKKRTIGNKRLFFILSAFFSLYVVYMLYMLSLMRVVYLYNYLFPLTISLIIFFTLLNYLLERLIQSNDARVFFSFSLFVLAIILAYWFFSPLTYYQPLTREQFLLRSWFPFWHLQPI